MSVRTYARSFRRDPAMGEARCAYTAPCPACGRDAAFVSVAQTEDGDIKRLLSVEVTCPCEESPA